MIRGDVSKVWQITPSTSAAASDQTPAVFASRPTVNEEMICHRTLLRFVFEEVGDELRIGIKTPLELLRATADVVEGVCLQIPCVGAFT